MTEDLKTNYSKAKYHSPQKYGEKLAIIFIHIARYVICFLMLKSVKML